MQYSLEVVEVSEAVFTLLAYFGIAEAMEDLRVELLEAMDRNFERKSFFGEGKWAGSAHGLIESGELRRSLRSEAGARSVTIYSDKEYAEIHNEGGRIKVTAKMRGYFWAKYKETKKEIWASLGKKAVGSYIEMPKRQFVGEHAEVTAEVEKVLSERLEGLMAGEMEAKIEK